MTVPVILHLYMTLFLHHTSRSTDAQFAMLPMATKMATADWLQKKGKQPRALKWGRYADGVDDLLPMVHQVGSGNRMAVFVCVY